MKKVLLLLAPLVLMAKIYSPDEVCNDTRLVMKEAKLINEKFKDPTNAVNLLGASAFRNILYRKPECMSEKEYLEHLDTYSIYLAKSENYSSMSTLENFIKQYPQHLNFYLTLGQLYEKQYYEQKRVDAREKALDKYTTYIKLAKEQHQSVDKNVLEFVESGGLQKADETWGQYLNPQGEIPLGAFKAFYIDTHQPKKIIASEIVKNISVNYPYKDFHNIDSANFGGYWVGKMKFAEDTKKTIYISQSNATTRVIVDGYILFDGAYRPQIEYLFKKGVHTIEVEHINRWHTTNLVVKIVDYIKKYNQQELKTKLDSSVRDDTQFWYVGAYESEKQDNSIILRVQKSDKPVVLLLESYRVVTWKIDNSYNTNIKAIVVHSNTPEATIEGDIKGIDIMYAQNRVGSGYDSGMQSERNRKCQCISGHFTCGGNGGFNADGIPRLYNKKVRGFSGKYASSILSVPEIEMSDKKYAEIESYKKKMNALQEKCYKNKNIKVDELFKSKQ